MSETKPRSAVRWLKWIGLGFLALVVIVALLLATSLPQRQLFKAALSKKHVQIEELSGFSMLGKVHIGRLTGVRKDSGKAPTTTRFDFKGITADYLLRPADKKNIPLVRVDVAKVQVEKAPPAPPAQKKEPKIGGGGYFSGIRLPDFKMDPQRFAAKETVLASLDFGRNWGSFGFDVGGLSVDLKRPNKKDMLLEVKGENAAASWWCLSKDAAHPFKGIIDLRVQDEKGIIAVDPLKVSFPGFVEAAGIVRTEKKGDDINCNVNLEKFVVQDVDCMAVDPKEAMPFAFKKIDLSGSRIQGAAGFNMAQMKAKSPEINLRAAVEGLRVGAKDHELYEGDILATLTGTAGNVNLALDLALNRGQKIITTLTGTGLTDIVSNTKLEWSRDDLLAALPKNARGALDTMPLRGLTASIETQMKMLSVDYQIALKPAFASGVPVEVTAKGTATVLTLPKTIPALFASLAAKLGDSAINIEKKAGTAPLIHRWECALEGVAPVQWAQVITGEAIWSPIDFKWNGTATIDADPAMQSFQLTLDLNQNDMKLKGKLTADKKAGWKMNSEGLDWTIGDKPLLALKNFSMDEGGKATKAEVAAVSFDLLSKLTTLPFTVAGTASGTLELTDGKVGVNLASTEGFAIDISPLKALLQAVNSDASKAVLAQIGDKEGVTPFDTANITPAEIRLKNKDMDLVISLTELSKIF